MPLSGNEEKVSVNWSYYWKNIEEKLVLIGPSIGSI